MSTRIARPLPRTQQFGSVTDFLTHMSVVHQRIERHTERGLERVAKVLAKDMRQQIGHYQPAVGPFPSWDALSPTYEARKVAAGFKAGAPLLRTGEMRDSIGHEVKGDQAVIGAKDPKAIAHELGTAKIPPRPFIGPAVFRNRKLIEQILGDALRDGVLGGELTDAGGYFD